MDDPKKTRSDRNRRSRATPDPVKKTKKPAGPRTKAAAIAAEVVSEKDSRAIPEAEQASADTVQQAAPPPEPPTSPNVIAAAVAGERDDGATPETVQGEAEQPRDDVAQPSATPAEPRTSGADSDMLAADRQGRRVAQIIFRQFGEQPFLTGLTGIALGYIIALLIHGRR